ncbi:hypothetical protein [Thalassoroseus pseudoceratinae]|uniref:hypothetical protein n=1 Tax=Thalassoroseus pseudoceratinae TaxID=2713176 RepID=UPI00142062B8|nr:hypothetical protein [Thalassoroseus pseudoceratinae]
MAANNCSRLLGRLENALRWIGLVGLVGASGCFSHYQSAPYSPYAPAPYQPYNSVPAYGSPTVAPPTGMPTPAYSAPLGTPQSFPSDGSTFGPSLPPEEYGSPQPVVPGGSSGTVPGSSDLPPPSGGSYDGGGTVPVYPDANTVPPAGGGGTFGGGNSTPFYPEGAMFQPDGSRGVENAANVQSTARASGVVPAGNTELSPYDRDPNGYSWLRGIVDYDPQDNVWIIFYSQVPQANDPFNGQITLADHPKLTGLQDGEVVFVEGGIDNTNLDPRTGFPKYRISRIVPLRASH